MSEIQDSLSSGGAASKGGGQVFQANPRLRHYEVQSPVQRLRRLLHPFICGTPTMPPTASSMLSSRERSSTFRAHHRGGFIGGKEDSASFFTVASEAKHLPVWSRPTKKHSSPGRRFVFSLLPRCGTRIPWVILLAETPKAASKVAVESEKQGKENNVANEVET